MSTNDSSNFEVISQPINFHVASTFKPYLDWVQSIQNKCYESRILDMVESPQDNYWFCWMCQLKTFIVEKKIPYYNVINVDMSKKPYLRYAVHVKYERIPLAPGVVGQTDSTVNLLVMLSLCRDLGPFLLKECANFNTSSSDYLEYVTFTYTNFRLNRGCGRPATAQAYKLSLSRFKSLLNETIVGMV
jgi:hypothetical protein